MINKKRVIFILAVVLELSILSFAGYSFVSDISPKKTTTEISYDKKYLMQNEAFYTCLGGWNDSYIPYREEYEDELQANLDLYTKHTGKTITTDDVKFFLEKKYTPDRRNKTWEDDETGIIKGFVIWCDKNKEVLDEYWDAVSDGKIKPIE